MYPRKLSAAAIFAGILLLCLSTAIQLLFPAELPHDSYFKSLYFKTPIIAMEFMRNSEEVLLFFKEGSPAYYEALQQGNLLDFVFMVVYGSLLVVAGLILARNNRKATRLTMVILPILAAISDLIENISLFELESSPFTDTWLNLLQAATLTKWMMLCFWFAGLYIIAADSNSVRPVYTGFVRIYGLLVLVCGLAAVLAYLAEYQFRGLLLETMALSIVLGFLTLYIHLLLLHRDNR